MSDIEKLKQAFIDFIEIQNSLREYGAGDTEPDTVWQAVVYAHVKGCSCKMPVSGQDWELFTHSMKCERAAKRLTAALKRILSAIDRCRNRDRVAVVGLCQYYCDRFYKDEWL